MAEREPVTQTVTTTDASQGFQKLVDKVSHRETRVVVEEDGKPVAAIISAPDFERFNRSEALRLEWNQILSRMRDPFKNVSEERLQRDVTEVVKEVRQARGPQR